MSDRELDYEVGRRLFGMPDAPCDCGRHGGEAHQQTAHIPLYSSTYEGAGMVIEEMQRRGFSWNADASVGANRTAWSSVAFWTLEGVPHEGAGDTFPEAVARAALAALGTPVEVRDE